MPQLQESCDRKHHVIVNISTAASTAPLLHVYIIKHYLQVKCHSVINISTAAATGKTFPIRTCMERQIRHNYALAVAVVLFRPF